MIQQQRQREVPNNKYNNYNNNNIDYNNKQNISSMQPPRLWRSQYKRRIIPNVNNINNFNHSEKPSVALKSVPAQPLATAALAPYGRIYQDNWKHL